MLMTLGLFVFDITTAAYDDLSRDAAWRHGSTGRVGRRPARQFLGQGEETITLSGKLMPQFTGGPSNIEQLRAMADAGEAWPLIEASGRNYGFFVIEKVTDRSSMLLDDGRAERIDFSVSLARIDEADLDVSATPAAGSYPVGTALNLNG